MTANPEALMDFDQAVVWMRVDPAALRQLAEDGGIPARRVGDAWLFSPSAIHAWIAASYFDKPKPSELAKPAPRSSEPAHGDVKQRTLILDSINGDDPPRPVSLWKSDPEAARRRMFEAIRTTGETEEEIEAYLAEIYRRRGEYDEGQE